MSINVLEKQMKIWNSVHVLIMNKSYIIAHDGYPPAEFMGKLLEKGDERKILQKIGRIDQVGIDRDPVVVAVVIQARSDRRTRCLHGPIFLMNDGGSNPTFLLLALTQTRLTLVI